MPKIAKQLTATAIKNIKEDGYYAVGGTIGLILRVRKQVKSYFFRYTFDGKRKMISIGKSDVVSLTKARQIALDHTTLLAAGVDPQSKRLEQEHGNKTNNNKLNFQSIARDWLLDRIEAGFWKHNIKGPLKTEGLLRNHIFPVIGSKNINSIDSADIRNLILPLYQNYPAASDKVLSTLRIIFRWAIAMKYRKDNTNPASLDGPLGVLLEPYRISRKKINNYAALPYEELPSFFKCLESNPSRSSDMLRFSILTATRSKAVRNARWEDIDLDKKVWTIPLEFDKNKLSNRDRRIFLNTQAVELLRNIIRFNDSPYIFCSSSGKPYSDMAMEQAIRREHKKKKLVDGRGWIDPEKSKQLGKECIVTQHGTARACFKTWAKSDENGNNKKFDQEAVELCLLHSRNDPYRGAYDRTKMEKERRSVMEEWGKYCTSLLRHI